jgi:uncharacterized membrane protein YqhA
MVDDMTKERGQAPPAAAGKEQRRRLEGAFERLLWSSRVLVLIAVVSAQIVAIMVFVFATADSLRVVSHVITGIREAGPRLVQARLELLAKVVKVVDLYLVATFMQVFAMGLYELFIGKIDIAQGSEVAHRLLLIRDLDDLKDRLGKIVLLIMAMLFLEQALRLELSSPLELLYLAVGVALVSIALYLSRREKQDTGCAM